MICDVCREGMASIWHLEGPRTLGRLRDFPNVLCRLFINDFDDGRDMIEVLGTYLYYLP